MIKIAYNGFHKNLRLAVNNVNNLLQQEYFYLGIQRHDSFDLADITPAQLADLLKVADFQIDIDLYYSLLPFSGTIIADNPEQPHVIRVNKWNLNQPLSVVCNALMHQCIHGLNAYFPQFTFGHGPEPGTYNENTAPFWIARLAQEIIAADSSIYEAMADDEVSELPFLQQFMGEVKRRPIFLPIRN